MDHVARFESLQTGNEWLDRCMSQIASTTSVHSLLSASSPQPGMQAGAVEALVQLLLRRPDGIAAELAAAALRNLAVRNAANREAIALAGGLPPLVHALSSGQQLLLQPWPCQVHRWSHASVSTVLHHKIQLLSLHTDCACQPYKR